MFRENNAKFNRFSAGNLCSNGFISLFSVLFQTTTSFSSDQNECGIRVCVCGCAYMGVCLCCSVVNVWVLCVFSEGKMVVLSLAIGLAEQDDFANLPDLQEAPANKENESSSEKR